MRIEELSKKIQNAPETKQQKKKNYPYYEKILNEGKQERQKNKKRDVLDDITKTMRNYDLERSFANMAETLGEEQ